MDSIKHTGNYNITIRITITGYYDWNARYGTASFIKVLQIRDGQCTITGADLNGSGFSDGIWAGILYSSVTLVSIVKV